MILVTGHKGAIGSKLFKKIGDVGIDLLDGQDLLTCELPENIDLIYHLAAHSSVENSWKDPMRDMQNLLTTVRLSTHYPNAKIIYAGSAAAEDPKSPYGFSKRAAQDYLEKFHKDYAITVFPNVYGTGRSVVDIFKDRKKVDIFGDGLQARDYVYIEDIVDGLLKAKDWKKGKYYMGTGKATTVLNLAKGKTINWLPARKESRRSVLKNTTPDWFHNIEVKNYIKNK